MFVPHPIRPYAISWLSLLLSFAVVWLGPAADCRAAIMRDGVPSSAYEEHSVPYKDSALWVTIEIPGYPGARGSRGSAVRLNEWYGLTAAHIVLDTGGDYRAAKLHVGTGANRLTDRGSVRTVTDVLIVPGWDPRNSVGYSPDLAIIKFDRPFPGPNLRIGGLVPNQDLVTSVGYGIHGYPANRYTVSDGNRRAFDAPFQFFTGWNNTFVLLGWANNWRVDSYTSGQGASGDSGSGVFNASGDLVGIACYAATGVPDIGFTGAQYLAAFGDWIAANTVVNPPPLFIQRDQTNVVLSWDGPYQLQTALTVDGTYTSLATATSPHTNATSNSSGFYRLVVAPDPPPQPPSTATNLGTLGVAANGTDHYCQHGVAGAIAGESNSRAIRLPAEPGADGGVMKIPFNPDLNPSGPFSVELWAKPGRTSYPGTLASSAFAPSSSERAGWILNQISSSGSGNGFSFRCYRNVGDNNQVRTDIDMSIDTNSWYHVVGVFDSTNVLLFVNGQQVASSPFPAGESIRANTRLALTFGASSHDNGWYDGDLDEAAIYTNALSAAQVMAHYQAGTNTVPSGSYQDVILADAPAGYWRLDEPDGPLPAPAALVAPLKIAPKPKWSPPYGPFLMPTNVVRGVPEYL